MSKTKSWVEKRDEIKEGYPKVAKIEGKLSKRWGEGTVVIPLPKEVDEIMRAVPKGKVITINEIREKLAKKHGATIGCPITIGIFAWVAAYAAEEEKVQEKNNTTPWWRTLKSGGLLNEKYPGGVENQKKLLEAEGHRVIKKGKNHFVADLETT